MTLIKQVTQSQKSLEMIANTALKLVHNHSSEAEILIIKTNGINISTRYGNVENIEYNNDEILKINIYSKQRKGSASSTNLSINSIKSTIDRALNIARFSETDVHAGLAQKDLLAYTTLDLDLFHPKEIDVKTGANLAAEAEQTALHSDKRIINSEGSNFSSSINTYVVANSYGMLQSYNSSKYALSCTVIAGSNNGMERDYAYTISRSFDSLFSPHWVGKECARRVLTRLNPRKLHTMKAPILFSAEITNNLFGYLVKAINGNNVYRKSTFLLHDLGNIILPKWISIYEYPHILQGLASAPFDTEGVKTNDRIIINNGSLNTWLLNNYAARKLKLQSTGHANGIYNWKVSYQEINFSQLLKIMGRGLIVTELMGEGFNVVTGNFSCGAVGFWVEHGEIQYPVNEVTIASNLRDMLNNIVNIGSDIETRNYIQCGSVLIDSMTIAGK